MSGIPRCHVPRLSVFACFIVLMGGVGCGEAELEVRAITPQAALPGANLQVVGTGLEDHKVTVGNVPAKVKSKSTDSLLVVELPKVLEPGNYDLVVTGQGAEISSKPMTVRVLDVVTVPSGTGLHVRTVESIHSGRTAVGTTFQLALEEPLTIDGRTVVKVGSRILGRVTRMEEAGRVKGRAEIGFTLVEMTSDGRIYSLTTDDALVRAEGTKGRDAATIGGSAGAGAVVGGILGGKKGAIIGGGVGGAAGTGVVLTTQGKDVDILPGTLFSFRLNQSVHVQIAD